MGRVRGGSGNENGEKQNGRISEMAGRVSHARILRRKERRERRRRCREKFQRQSGWKANETMFVCGGEVGAGGREGERGAEGGEEKCQRMLGSNEGRKKKKNHDDHRSKTYERKQGARARV